MTQPATFAPADQIMIDVDGFLFGPTAETGRPQWIFTLPFSEIMELRYEPTGGEVRGTLQDGAGFGFHIDQGLAAEDAMRFAAARFGSKIELSARSVDEATPGDGVGADSTVSALEGAFASASEFGAEPQVRRFAELAAGAGLDVRWNWRCLAARAPGIKKHPFEIRWYPNSRFRMVVLNTGAFGEGESRALDALPATTVVRRMDAVDVDRFLDALSDFLAAHPVEPVPDRPEVRANVEHSEKPAPGIPLNLRMRRVPFLSDEEIAEALRPLERRFKNAAGYGVEPQARRFAELTAAADLDVRWNGRGLDAVWRRTQRPIFYLIWGHQGVEGGLGVGRVNTEPGSSHAVLAEEAFDWHPNPRRSGADTVPGVAYTREMDTAETIHTTDLFLDWLQGFLASHSIPSREDEAIWRTEERLGDRGCGPAVLALSSIVWFGIVVFFLELLPGEFPWGEPVGWIIAGLLLLAVPVTAVLLGVAARKEVRDYKRNHPNDSRFNTVNAWLAIVFALLMIALVLTFFILLVT